jgi:DnaJ-class molecular chaperone
MIRFIFFAALLAVAYFIAKLVLKPSGSIRCSRCDGRGFWLAARGREKCDWCKGTGRLPRK